MPCDYREYPTDWKEQRRQILEQANDCCEFCGVENYTLRENGAKVVLTIAHLKHDLKQYPVWPDELAALCQRCHNRWDAQYRLRNRREKAMDKNQIWLFPPGYLIN